MKKFNDKRVAVTYRNGVDFDENLNLRNVFTTSLYSPVLGVVVDWTCNENVSFKVSTINSSAYSYGYVTFLTTTNICLKLNRTT